MLRSFNILEERRNKLEPKLLVFTPAARSAITHSFTDYVIENWENSFYIVFLELLHNMIVPRIQLFVLSLNYFISRVQSLSLVSQLHRRLLEPCL